MDESVHGLILSVPPFHAQSAESDQLIMSIPLSGQDSLFPIVPHIHPVPTDEDTDSEEWSEESVADMDEVDMSLDNQLVVQTALITHEDGLLYILSITREDISLTSPASPPPAPDPTPTFVVPNQQPEGDTTSTPIDTPSLDIGGLASLYDTSDSESVPDVDEVDQSLTMVEQEGDVRVLEEKAADGDAEVGSGTLTDLVVPAVLDNNSDPTTDIVPHTTEDTIEAVNGVSPPAPLNESKATNAQDVTTPHSSQGIVTMSHACGSVTVDLTAQDTNSSLVDFHASETISQTTTAPGERIRRPIRPLPTRNGAPATSMKSDGKGSEGAKEPYPLPFPSAVEADIDPIQPAATNLAISSGAIKVFSEANNAIVNYVAGCLNCPLDANGRPPHAAHQCHLFGYPLPSPSVRSANILRKNARAAELGGLGVLENGLEELGTTLRCPRCTGEGHFVDTCPKPKPVPIPQGPSLNHTFQPFSSSRIVPRIPYVTSRRPYLTSDHPTFPTRGDTFFYNGWSYADLDKESKAQVASQDAHV